MNHRIEAQWMGKMQFNALVNGHTVIMDAPERVGGEGHGLILKPYIRKIFNNAASAVSNEIVQ